MQIPVWCLEVASDFKKRLEGVEQRTRFSSSVQRNEASGDKISQSPSWNWIWFRC